MYGIAFEREIDCSFVVLVTILKHFEKKFIKKYWLVDDLRPIKDEPSPQKWSHLYNRGKAAICMPLL